MTPYIYDSRADVEDIYQGLRFWYNQGQEERSRCGLIGRDWAIENGFTKNNMCDTMMNGIETCFENFEPRKRYTLIKTSDPKPVYPSGVIK